MNLQCHNVNNMKENDTITASIESVKLHKEERKVIGAVYGTYESHYIVHLNEYPKGIVIIDELAAQLHSNWKKKTDNRAKQLSVELKNKQVTLRVMDIFPNGDFEAVLV